MDLYREHILDHYQHPRNRGSLPKPTLSVDEQNPLCGDQLHFDILLADGRVTDIKFRGQGCAISLAGASILTEEAKGKSLQSVQALRDPDMLELLGIELSPTRLKCGLLAISGLRKAAQQYNEALT